MNIGKNCGSGSQLLAICFKVQVSAQVFRHLLADCCHLLEAFGLVPAPQFPFWTFEIPNISSCDHAHRWLGLPNSEYIGAAKSLKLGSDASEKPPLRGYVSFQLSGICCTSRSLLNLVAYLPPLSLQCASTGQKSATSFPSQIIFL